jgi:hypothetical protein
VDWLDWVGEVDISMDRMHGKEKLNHNKSFVCPFQLLETLKSNWVLAKPWL